LSSNSEGGQRYCSQNSDVKSCGAGCGSVWLVAVGGEEPMTSKRVAANPRGPANPRPAAAREAALRSRGERTGQRCEILRQCLNSLLYGLVFHPGFPFNPSRAKIANPGGP